MDKGLGKSDNEWYTSWSLRPGQKIKLMSMSNIYSVK